MFCSSDLQTVLLYNFDNNTSTPHGRAIRFLDTSGQTFVAGGATTSYGTQVIGTRLENGHVVGQVLSTTSRVLFDSTKVGTPIEAHEFLAETGKLLRRYLKKFIEIFHQKMTFYQLIRFQTPSLLSLSNGIRKRLDQQSRSLIMRSSAVSHTLDSLISQRR